MGSSALIDFFSLNYAHELQECYGRMRGPVSIMWDVTNRCNLRCVHCYNSSGWIDPPVQDLPDETMLSIVEQILEMRPFVVCLCGGEPTTRKITPALVRRLSSTGIVVNMVSNGTLLDKSKVAEFKTAGISSVQISVDGACAETHDRFRGREGSFTRALSAISNLLSAGIDVPVTFIPTKMNFREFPEALDMVARMGVTNFRMMPLVPMGRSLDRLQELELSPEESWELSWMIHRARSRYPGVSIEWGDPMEHIYLFPRNPKARTYCIEIRNDGSLVPSTYFPLVVGNVTKHTLREYWDAGLKDIWRHPTITEWIRGMVCVDDIRHQPVAPWSGKDVSLDLIPASEKRGG